MQAKPLHAPFLAIGADCMNPSLPSSCTCPAFNMYTSQLRVSLRIMLYLYTSTPLLPPLPHGAPPSAEASLPPSASHRARHWLLYQTCGSAMQAMDAAHAAPAGPTRSLQPPPPGCVHGRVLCRIMTTWPSHGGARSVCWHARSLMLSMPLCMHACTDVEPCT